MNQSKSARVIGLIQNVPGVCTFVRPVFAMDSEQYCLQKIEGDRIAGWDFFPGDASIVPISSSITRVTGDLAIVGCEYVTDEVLIGEVSSVAHALYKDTASLSQLEKTNPACYEGYRIFFSEILALNANTDQDALIEKQKVPFSTLKGDGMPVSLRINVDSADNGQLLRVNNTRLRVGTFPFVYNSSAGAVRFQEAEFAKFVHSIKSQHAPGLVKEAEVLLGHRMGTQKLVSEVFSAWATDSQIVMSSSDPLASIRKIFRRLLFTSLSSKVPNHIHGQRKMVKSYHITQRTYQPSFALMIDEGFSSQSSADDYYLKKFKAFQKRSPEAACLYYWVCQDGLDIDDVCSIISDDTAAALVVLNEGYGILRSLIRESVIPASPSLLPKNVHEVLKNFSIGDTVQKASVSTWLSSITQGGDLNFLDRVTRSEVDFLRKLVQGTRRAVGLEKKKRLNNLGREVSIDHLIGWSGSKDRT
jgi:hypothetical protein